MPHCTTLCGSDFKRPTQYKLRIHKNKLLMSRIQVFSDKSQFSLTIFKMSIFTDKLSNSLILNKYCFPILFPIVWQPSWCLGTVYLINMPDTPASQSGNSKQMNFESNTVGGCLHLCDLIKHDILIWNVPRFWADLLQNFIYYWCLFTFTHIKEMDGYCLIWDWFTFICGINNNFPTCSLTIQEYFRTPSIFILKLNTLVCCTCVYEHYVNSWDTYFFSNVRNCSALLALMAILSTCTCHFEWIMGKYENMSHNNLPYYLEFNQLIQLWIVSLMWTSP